jgi:hypothetical protein
MNNPLLPNPRRVNWLGKEPEPDLSWDDLKEFIHKNLLKELKEAPVMLINPDNSRSFYGSIECPEGIIPDSDDPDWEGHYYPEEGIDPGFDPENETFFEYLDRMWR